MTNLKELDLSRNKISDIKPISKLTGLTSLVLDAQTDKTGEKRILTDISVLAGLTNLTKLSLGNNGIKDISVLNSLTNLKYLNLNYQNNEETDSIHIKFDDLTPLSNLVNLEHLFLEDNNFYEKNFDFLKNMNKLVTLDLSNNYVRDIDILADNY